jgi:hypothetical protein
MKRSISPLPAVMLLACAMLSLLDVTKVFAEPPSGSPQSPRRDVRILTDIVPAPVAQKLVAWLADVEAWVLDLDVGSGVLKNTEDTADSIFINGNFARLLNAIYRITGKSVDLAEALRWCDSFFVGQRLAITSEINEAGYWVDLNRNLKGNIYFGDGGTAASAMASILDYADPKKRWLYLKALERYARFVADGCLFDPQRLNRESTASWVIEEGDDKGALGCGFYEGHLSVKPYTIATATTGGAFFSALYALTEKPEYKNIAQDAVSWLLKIRKPDGEIPYVLDGQTSEDWPLDTLSYCTEAFIAADVYLKDAELKMKLGTELKPTVEWLLARQNPDGSWGVMQSPDQQRSPRAVTLLAWYYRNVEPDPKIKDAVLNYCLFLLDPEKSKDYGIKKLVRTTGFAGLTVAEILQPGSTY